jgi:type VI protein secretion system component Hcp
MMQRLYLAQVYVSDYASGTSAEDDRFTEQVMFTFAKITFTQRSLDPAGRPLEPVTICYDVSRAGAC